MCVRCRQNSDVRVKLFPSPQAAITLLGGAAENATIGDPMTLPFRCSAPLSHFTQRLPVRLGIVGYKL
jgi:hypothetical protein